jgi:hypothetical protein
MDEKTVTYIANVLDEEICSSNHAVYDVISETFVLVIRHLPWDPTRSHRDVDYGGSPDVHSFGIKFAAEITFWWNVRVWATILLRQGCFFLPTKVETFNASNVGNLETTTGAEKNVLWLQVTMSKAYFMDIMDAAHELFKKTVGFGLCNLTRCDD